MNSKPMPSAVQSVVFDALAELTGASPSSLSLDTRLHLGELGLDSIMMLELILALETRLGTDIHPERLDQDVIATIGSLVLYLDAIDD